MSNLLDIFSHKEHNTRQAHLARLAQSVTGDRLFFLLARLLYRLKVIGVENIPPQGPCIFAINHEALLTDSLCYLVARRARPDLHFFAWQNLKDENPMLHFMQNFGEQHLEQRYLRVYKARGLSAGELLRARHLLLAGESVLITAEGFLTWDGKFQHPLEPGAVWMALRTGSPIIPMVSRGGYDIQPYWDIEHIRLTGRITIRIGQPVQFDHKPELELEPGLLESANEELWQMMYALWSS